MRGLGTVVVRGSLVVKKAFRIFGCIFGGRNCVVLLVLWSAERFSFVFVFLGRVVTNVARTYVNIAMWAVRRSELA